MSFNFSKKEEVNSKKKRYFWTALVLSVTILLISNIIIAYFFVSQKNTVKNFANKYPLIDLSRNFIDQKYFFSTIEPLREEMKRIAAIYEKRGNRIGVYFEFLNTGANISINQDERFWPASLSKIPTIFAVIKKIEDGEWKLGNELVLFTQDQDERFGDLYKKTPGTRFTIEELIKETLINSDNTTHNILVRNLSSTDYTDVISALGMENLFDKNYDITAKEYSRIFRALYTASYLNRENSQKILKWLSQTNPNFNEFLGAGVPLEVLFSHKIGEQSREVVFLDSGIVYVPNRPYLITVMVQIKDGNGDAEAKEIMKELSKAAYTYVANN